MRLKFNATAIPVAGFINEAQKYAAKTIQAKEIAGYFEANFCKSLKNNKYFAAFWKRLTKRRWRTAVVSRETSWAHQ
jgi:hypothetical protein